MIKKIKTRVELIATDSLDEDNNYYLYEVWANGSHYYTSRSDEEINNEDSDVTDYSNEYNMLERKDFSRREWEIAKYLFNFLWNSENGTNTCIDEEFYEDDGFTYEEIEEFANKFGLFELGVLDDYGDGSIEIYWAYFSIFDLNTCNLFE